MFDKSDIPTLVIGIIFASAISFAMQSGSPELADIAPIDTAALPAVPVADAKGAAPLQTEVPTQTVDLGGGFQATLLYAYSMDGIVVTRRIFRADATSGVSPLDLGIVWGDLAEPGATEGFRFTAGRRMMSFRTDGGALPPMWEEQVTNNHLIPASDAVREALMAIEVGQNVRLTGYLVSVTGNGIHPWRSSIRRDDSSLVGGCEIILVRTVEVLNPDA